MRRWIWTFSPTLGRMVPMTPSGVKRNAPKPIENTLGTQQAGGSLDHNREIIEHFTTDKKRGKTHWGEVDFTRGGIREL